MKILNRLIIFLLFLLLQSTLYAQNESFEQFSDNFELKAFENLHLYLPIRYDWDFHALDPYAYKGKKMDNALMEIMGKQVNYDYETYYAVYRFYISHNIIGFIIRQGGGGQNLIGSMDLYIYNKKKCVQNISLAGYNHGESGGVMWESWIEDINDDGILDIITRERLGSWDELEHGGKDSVKVYIWQDEKYIEYVPHNISKFLAAYSIFYNPFSSRGITLEDINKDLKQAENVYTVILSSDTSFEAARFEETRFEKEYTFHKRTFYYFDLLCCSIYKKTINSTPRSVETFP